MHVFLQVLKKWEAELVAHFWPDFLCFSLACFLKKKYCYSHLRIKNCSELLKHRLLSLYGPDNYRLLWFLQRLIIQLQYYNINIAYFVFLQRLIIQLRYSYHTYYYLTLSLAAWSVNNTPTSGYQPRPCPTLRHLKYVIDLLIFSISLLIIHSFQSEDVFIQLLEKHKLLTQLEKTKEFVA